MIMPYCAHYRLFSACYRLAVAGGEQAVAGALYNMTMLL